MFFMQHFDAHNERFHKTTSEPLEFINVHNERFNKTTNEPLECKSGFINIFDEVSLQILQELLVKFSLKMKKIDDVCYVESNGVLTTFDSLFTLGIKQRRVCWPQYSSFENFSIQVKSLLDIQTGTFKSGNEFNMTHGGFDTHGPIYYLWKKNHFQQKKIQELAEQINENKKDLDDISKKLDFLIDANCVCQSTLNKKTKVY